MSGGELQPTADESFFDHLHEVYQQDTDHLLDALKSRDDYHVHKVKEALEDSANRVTAAILGQLPQHVQAGLEATTAALTPALIAQAREALLRQAEQEAELKYLDIGKREFSKDFWEEKNAIERENLVVRHRREALDEIVSRLEDKKVLLVGRRRETARVRSDYELALAQARLGLEADAEFVQDLREEASAERRGLEEEIRSLEGELTALNAGGQVLDLRQDELTSELTLLRIGTRKHSDTLQNAAYSLSLRLRDAARAGAAAAQERDGLRERTGAVERALARLSAVRWLYKAQFREQREATLVALEQNCEPLLMEMHDVNTDVPPPIAEPLPDLDVTIERTPVKVRRLMEADDHLCEPPDIETRWAMRQDDLEETQDGEGANEDEGDGQRFAAMVPDAGEPGRCPAPPRSLRVIYCMSNHVKIKWNPKFVPRDPLSSFDDIMNGAGGAAPDGRSGPDAETGTGPQSTSASLAPLRYSVVLYPLADRGQAIVTPKVARETSMSFTGLEPETAYEMTVTAVSRYGASEPARLTFATPAALRSYRKPPRPTNLVSFSEGTQTTLTLVQPRAKSNPSSLSLPSTAKRLEPVARKMDVSKFRRAVSVGPPELPRPLLRVTDELILDEAMSTMELLLRA